MSIIAKRFDGVERDFNSVSEVIRWADGEGLNDWRQPSDYVVHTGIPGKCGELVVHNSEGLETDARISWWRDDAHPAYVPGVEWE